VELSPPLFQLRFPWFQLKIIFSLWLYFYLFISPIVLVLQIIVSKANSAPLSCIASVPCYSPTRCCSPSLTSFGFGSPNSIHTQTTWKSIHAIQEVEMLKCNKLIL
jgi:hypothetical protein